jgi:GLPGLI family protein
MNKRFLFAALLIVFCGTMIRLQAQQTEGKVRYLTSYDWVKMINQCDYLDKTHKDQASYMWGNRSQWNIYNTLYFSSKKSKYENSEEKAPNDFDDEGYAGRKETFFITRNFETNTLFNALEMLGKTYLVSDSLKTPDWKILNDLKEVAGHVCMNASLSDTLRKQKISAWFALDIPVPTGPDRFFGLPGMILEVNINNGAKIMTADKIDFKTLTTEFDLPKKLKGKQINYAAYTAIIKKFLEDKRKAEEFPWGMEY